jgi:hypothetical protein
MVQEHVKITQKLLPNVQASFNQGQWNTVVNLSGGGFLASVVHDYLGRWLNAILTTYRTH